ncbi:MAG: hypothetical protein HY543_10760, partial [Deltaproteobacteria bacterium]|nr:hypothetical protein [Deltaproteobacteria bacterium]
MPVPPPPQRRRFTGRRWIVALLLLGYGAVALFRWVNTPAVQQRLVAWLTRHSSWEIALDRWDWRFVAGSLRITNLYLRHRTTGHALAAHQIVVRYSPLALATARLRIHEIFMDNVRCDFSAMPPPRADRPRIDFKKLLLLRRLTITSATAHDVVVKIPGDRFVSAEDLHLQFLPKLFRDVRMNLQLMRPILAHAGTPRSLHRRSWIALPTIRPIVTADLLTYSSTTDMSQWVDTPPFVNAVTGAVTLTNGRWRKLTVTSHTARAEFDDSRITAENFHALINNQPLEGSGAVDLAKRTYRGELTWPHPMPIPELLGPDSFFRTAGTVQGHIAVEGRGSLAAGTGTAEVDLTHQAAAETTVPARLVAKASWKNGRLAFGESALLVGDARVAVAGGIDLTKPEIQIAFRGDRVPMEGVFGRFTDPHYHPLRGAASVDGRFRGWHRDYLLDLTARAPEVRYYDIVAPVEMQMKLTYPRLDLQGRILQDGRVTGTADLTVTYAPKIANLPRKKQMRLEARLAGHALGPSFAAYHLTGTGDGTLTIQGPPEAFRATGRAEIHEGAFYDLPLTQVWSDLTIVPRLLTFTKGAIEVRKIAPLEFSQPLKMEILDDAFHFIGTPRPGLRVDALYHTRAGRWAIREIAAADPARPEHRLLISGEGRAGGWNLYLRGRHDLALLTELPTPLREAAGPMQIDLHVTGALDRPRLNGTVQLARGTMVIRNFPYELEDVTGTLRFQEQTIHFEPLAAQLGEGRATLTGWIKHDGFRVTGFDARAVGSMVHIASAD